MMKTACRLLFLLFLVFILLSITCGQHRPGSVDIHYLGHSSFILRFDNGLTLVIDYGHENAYAEWGWDGPVHEMGGLIPDIMTFSHEHDNPDVQAHLMHLLISRSTCC